MVMTNVHRTIHVEYCFERQRHRCRGHFRLTILKDILVDILCCYLWLIRFASLGRYSHIGAYKSRSSQTHYADLAIQPFSSLIVYGNRIPFICTCPLLSRLTKTIFDEFRVCYSLSIGCVIVLKVARYHSSSPEYPCNLFAHRNLITSISPE